MLLLGLFAYKASTEGLSNFYAQSAQLEIERWSKPGQTLRGDEGTRVMQYLGSSLDHSPNNPWPLEVMGTLQLRSMSAAKDPQLAMAAARGANVNFRMALAQRPTSPFAWASLALTKLYLGEQDEELFRALERAEELGPWEPEVQQAVVFVGLTLWNRLNPAQQATVVRAMDRGARRNPGKIAEIAKTFDRIDLFCGLSYSDSQGREVCSSISKSGFAKKRDRQQ
ncbi:MAG: hypothetical protein EPO19_04530 [Betaproteobacteria bacterium]|nr:MAG: hypothetical protein EPO19_04530 [Betaproteobacteria bacterium]